MQWLIDIILALIDETDIYINRGDFSDADFVTGDFTRDGAWHDLDLSAIVPANVTAVSIRTTISSTAIAKSFLIRTAGNVNTGNIFISTTQVANIFRPAMGTVYPSSSRHIEYLFTDATVNNVFMAINGWWLKKN